jgi:DNA repair protein RecO (recombination protein O)
VVVSGVSRAELVSAFVLHQRPYRESSVLVEAFTGSQGRVGLVARGIRTAKSRQRGELQPFRPLRLSWHGRGELGTLTGVEADGPAGRLAGDALFSAFYLNELLLRLLARHDPHPHLYRLYAASLRLLGEQASVEPVLRQFEKGLLEEIGYGLLLDTDAASGEPVQADRCYDYHLESGPVTVSDKHASGFVFRGSSLLAIAAGRLDNDDVLFDAKRLMRSALNLYLGGKPLKSRELFQAVKKQCVSGGQTRRPTPDTG